MYLNLDLIKIQIDTGEIKHLRNRVRPNKVYIYLRLLLLVCVNTVFSSFRYVYGLSEITFK